MSEGAIYRPFFYNQIYVPYTLNNNHHPCYFIWSFNVLALEYPKTFKEIKNNLSDLMLENKSNVKLGDSIKSLKYFDNKYKLIFADPPYNSFEPKELIENINNQNILDTNGLLIIEHKNQLKIETKYNQMKCISKRKYGDSAISIFKKENNG